MSSSGIARSQKRTNPQSLPAESKSSSKSSNNEWTSRYLPLAVAIDTETSVVAGQWKEGQDVRYIYFRREVDSSKKGTTMTDEIAHVSEEEEDDESNTIPRQQRDDEDEDEMASIKRRSLIVVGAPLFFGPDEIEQCFSIFADVESAFATTLKPVRGSHKFTVVMADEDGVDTVYSQYKTAKAYVSPSSSNLGINKWTQEYLTLRPDYSQLQTQVDMFLHAFDTRTEAQKKAMKNKPLVDEDGFRLVINNKRKNTSDSKLKQDRKQALRKQARKDSERVQASAAFYRLQEFEKKQEKLATLRKKFEEDRARIQAMRSQRKFKPM